MFIGARTVSPELERESRLFFTPTVLDSDEARNLRERYEECNAPDVTANAEPLDWLPHDRIEYWLARYEKGEQGIWWALLREMTLEDTSECYGRVFEPDITTLPGWENSDSNARRRIINAAESYLKRKRRFDLDGLLDGKASEKDIAPYKAFHVLLKECPERLDELRDDQWSYWIPVLFGPFGYNGNRAVQKILIGLAYRKIPDAVIDYLEQVLRHQIKKEDQYLSVFDLVEDIWDQKISNRVCAVLEFAETKPLCWGRMVRKLLANGDKETQKLAEGELQLPLPQDDDARDISLQAALALVESVSDAAWGAVWPIICKDTQFGRRVVMEVSHDLHHTYETFFSKLHEGQLADLFVWLVQQFPPDKDPQSQ